jgi:hypothetical protein
MADGKLSIGCVLLVSGALTHGGIVGCSVGTPAERTNERGVTGGSGFVGVPPDDEVGGSGGSGASGSAGNMAGEGGGEHGGESPVGGAAGGDGS